MITSGSVRLLLMCVFGAVILHFFNPNPLFSSDTTEQKYFAERPSVSTSSSTENLEENNKIIKTYLTASIDEPTEPESDVPPVQKWYQKNKDRFLLIAYATLLYSVSDLEGSEPLNGGDISAALIPTLMYNPKTSIMAMYNGRYYKRREFYSDDVGPLERAEYQSHTFTPMVRYNFGERGRYFLTPSLFYTKTLNKDIDTDAWDEGLYNYNDIGGGVDFRMIRAGFYGGDGTLSLGTQLYQREYPNYESLLDLATGIGVEKDEKDYLGILLKAGYSWINRIGFSWMVDYSMLYKILDNKKVVDENGFLTSTGQRDYFHSIRLEPWYMLLGQRLRIGLGFTFDISDSNQNWYDALDSISLEDDVFTPKFYNYFSYRIRPNIAYTFNLLGRYPITATYAFAFQTIDYSDRRAKFSDGTYKTETQEDNRYENFFELRYDMKKWLSILGQVHHISNRSNNEDERVYRYDYTVYNYFAGISLNYYSNFHMT